MSYPLGQPVTLSVTWKDANQTPANAGTMTLSIVLPDGTADSTPGTQTGTSGAYAYVYTSAQVGHHIAVWTGTGTNAGVVTEPFDVIAVNDSAGIVSLAEAKLALNITSTGSDAELQSLLVALTPVVEHYAGPIIRRTVTEWHDGGSRVICLRQMPVISVTSVTEYAAQTNYPLTEQPLDAGPFTQYGFTLNTTTAQVLRMVNGYPGWFLTGIQNVKVVYLAGRAVIPENVKKAALELARWNWRPQRAQGPSTLSGVGTGDSVGLPPGVTFQGFFVPNYVIELLGGEQRLPGIA